MIAEEFIFTKGEKIKLEIQGQTQRVSSNILTSEDQSSNEKKIKKKNLPCLIPIEVSDILQSENHSNLSRTRSHHLPTKKEKEIKIGGKYLVHMSGKEEGKEEGRRKKAGAY